MEDFGKTYKLIELVGVSEILHGGGDTERHRPGISEPERVSLVPGD
jgi:hypothetical protein